LSAASSIRPPRAQLMMRTPFLVLARFSRLRILRVWSVRDVCRVMKSALRQQRVEICLLHAHFHRAFLGEEGIVGNDLHLEAKRAAGDDRADVARADQAKRLAGHLNAHEAVLRPLARLGARIGFGNLAGDGEHHGDGVFGSRDRVAERRVHHHHALGRAGIGNIDIVDTDPGAADDLEIGGGVEHFLRHLGGRLRMARPSYSPMGDELFRRLAGDDIDIAAALFERSSRRWGPSCRK
jgi:hypothetical protein